MERKMQKKIERKKEKRKKEKHVSDRIKLFPFDLLKGAEERTRWKV
jgi:hypothetical protein